MKVKTLNDIKNILIKNKTNFILNLEDANMHQRTIILSFIAGLTYEKGNIKKLDCNNFKVVL